MTRCQQARLAFDLAPTYLPVSGSLFVPVRLRVSSCASFAQDASALLTLNLASSLIHSQHFFRLWLDPFSRSMHFPSSSVHRLRMVLGSGAYYLEQIGTRLHQTATGTVRKL